ncbi:MULTISPECIES: dihydrofolate reductase family protein [Geobacter]|uniref:dihydrofolate reductase family protein n=1 Tax=Geobacter TaxID=28231 RepID=UPI00257462B7|nr:dihydrofolate reductase family protein [Geobacter sulfurreducens]BEH10444.1 hypothetical protein GSUET_20560 [Geobacter sulfurreducens subsp. ethanolicus]BET57967.1 hypothetical protein GEO60473_10070 [Geobacter sp. 60473]HML78407.1 dihydrofolate reductase family protein [Geobacter sulfurreducens]
MMDVIYYVAASLDGYIATPDGGVAWLVGGGVLAASFLQRRLVSEYIVSVVPIILGGGIPMISPNGIRESLTLLETRVCTGGIMQVRYRSEGH